jgi:hypothetical protein
MLHFKMDTLIVQPKQFKKEEMQTQVEIPNEKAGKETSYPFQWLLFKPQLHAITPFPTQSQTRLENSERK